MSKELDLGIRVHALVLHSEGYTRASIMEKTGYSAGGLSNLLTKAKSRGYTPGKGPILLEYVDNEPGRTGRPRKVTQEQRDQIVASLALEKEKAGAAGGGVGGKGKFVSTQKLADKFNAENPEGVSVSRRTVLRALNSAGIKHSKGTPKSGVKKQVATTTTSTV